jgi:hypothetical protein
MRREAARHQTVVGSPRTFQSAMLGTFADDKSFAIDAAGHVKFQIPSQFNEKEVFDGLQERLRKGRSQLMRMKESYESQQALVMLL